MGPLLLTDIESAIRSSWDADTTTPVHRPHWNPGNPARDQCGVTALVVNDLLGGELIRGEVLVAGERVDHHWWNRLGQDLDIDLTREQFAPHEIVSGGVVIERPAEIVRLREEYELLSARVQERLRGRIPAGARAVAV
ncbi:YunG family protein [Streptomyces pratensis]|uniref:YunG family protein n=1 Tax=Streptomyces pratensis TaxID=1169025 RepID=UPI00362FCC94